MDVRIEYDGTAATQAAINRALTTVVTNATLDIAALAAERAPRDTGNLAASVQADTTEAGTNTHQGKVEIGAEYGFFVEEGTVHQAAQPFMAPAVAEVEAALPRVAEAVLAREMGGS